MQSTVPHPTPSKSRKRRKRWSFISPTGEVITTDSIRRFAQEHDLKYSKAKDMAAGIAFSHYGWISTHPHAKKRRERMLTVLVNSRTGEKGRVGTAVTNFARQHGLAINDTYQLLNGHLICYRGWMKESTYLLTQGPSLDS